MLSLFINLAVFGFFSYGLGMITASSGPEAGYAGFGLIGIYIFQSILFCIKILIQIISALVYKTGFIYGFLNVLAHLAFTVLFGLVAACLFVYKDRVPLKPWVPSAICLVFAYISFTLFPSTRLL